MLKIFLPAVALACAALSLVPLSATAAEPPFPVAEAKSRPVQRQSVQDGLVEAVNRSTVSAQAAGRITEINFDVDDYVKKGSVLLRLRNTGQRAALNAKQAGLREAEARLSEAQKAYDRIKGVYAKKLVSKSDMDRATASLKAAKARYQAAQAQVQQASETLEHTVVRAPYSGIVTRRFVELGETTAAGKPLMTGLSLENLRVTADVPQALVPRLREDPAAEVQLADGTRLKAEKVLIFPIADEVTHTFRVRLSLPQGQHGLYPGMFVKAIFPAGETAQLLVPADAVVYRSEVTGVYVLDPEGRVALRQIRVGRRLADGSIEVLAGLGEGERVAVDPIRAGIYLKQQLAGSLK